MTSHVLKAISTSSRIRILGIIAIVLVLLFVGAQLSVHAHEGQSGSVRTGDKKAVETSSLDAEKIGAAIGTKAMTTPDGVVRMAWNRTDVKVTVDGMPLQAFAGLSSDVAFTPTKDGAMIMGDTVVFADEITPAMDAAFAAGLGVTGLHHHFVYDEPKVYFMHIGGAGDAQKLAAGIKSVWDAIKQVRAKSAVPATRSAEKTPKVGLITAAPLDQIVGLKSRSRDGIVVFMIGREGSMHGIKVGASMGLSSIAAFSGDDQLATMYGDFIMTAEEVQPVLRALRKADVDIVALHNHMVGEQPAFYFTHFSGKGSPQQLAKGLKSALDEQARVAKK